MIIILGLKLTIVLANTLLLVVIDILSVGKGVYELMGCMKLLEIVWYI